MLLHCTQKLAARLPEVSATPLAEPSPLGGWHWPDREMLAKVEKA